MSNYEKNLIGRSIPLDEVDDEESNLNDMIPIAEMEADFIDVIDNFGKEEFKFIFLNVLNELQNIEFEKQRELCEKLNEKVFEIYNFEFTPQLVFDDQEDINNYLNFIAFLEYDYVDIISEIISNLDLNLLRRDTNKFLLDNFEKIIININNLIQNEKIIGLISIFLRTNNKDGLYQFMDSRLRKDKMLIILHAMERNM